MSLSYYNNCIPNLLSELFPQMLHWWDYLFSITLVYITAWSGIMGIGNNATNTASLIIVSMTQAKQVLRAKRILLLLELYLKQWYKLIIARTTH